VAETVMRVAAGVSWALRCSKREEEGGGTSRRRRHFFAKIGNMGPGGEGWGPALILRWNNQVAWITVCEPLNARIPP